MSDRPTVSLNIDDAFDKFGYPERPKEKPPVRAKVMIIRKPTDLDHPIFVDISDFVNNENIGMKRPMYEAYRVGQIIEAVMKCVSEAVENVHTSGLSESESMRVSHECDGWAIIAKDLQRIYGKVQL